MNILPFRLLLKHLLTITISLALWTGISQAAVDDNQAAGSSSVATLKAITVSPDAYQVEILADKDLTYTFYKTLNPVRAVIDLAQTEPAGLAAQEINAGMVKRINITKHSFGGGFLSRVEILLTSDDEFTVSSDPADKRKLILKFSKSLPEKSVTPVAIPESVPVNTPVKQDDAGVKAAAEPSKDLVTTTTTEKSELPADQQKPVEVPQQQKMVTSFDLLKESMEIKISGEPDSFKSFRMDKPGRLVLDLFGVRSAIKENAIEVNSMGISRVRIGLTPEKVRFVFDSQQPELPEYKVEKIDTGIKVTFTPVSPELVSNVSQVGKKGETVAAATSRKKEVASIDAIDFDVAGEYSRITIAVAGNCNPGKPVKVAKGVALTFKNCQLPKKLQRVMDTGAFQSVVLAVTPYPVKTKTGTDARLLLNLRADAPSTVQKHENSFVWEIRNTEIPKHKAEDNSKGLKSGAGSVQEELAADTGLEIKADESTTKFSSKQPVKKKYTGRKVSLEFSDADVRKIFQLIAEVSNLNFLIADDVTGTISIKLVNVPWDQALDVILESKGLEMKRDGNIIQIKPKGKFKTIEQEMVEAKKAKERLLELVTEIIEINFANVSDVERQFSALKSDRGTITKDDRTNRIIVKDVPSAIEEMKFLLKNIDIPEKQVLIEARIVEATTRFSQDLGVQWALHATDSSAKVLNVTSADAGWGGVIGLPAPASGFLASNKYGMGLGMSFGKIGPDVQLDMRLSAAASNGQVKIISSPKVVTLNNKQAKISQGSAFYLSTTSAEGTKQEKVDATLSLEVKPHITPDGSIIMTITAKNDAPEATPPSGATASVSKKEATTELLVKNGETTVIGGIYIDRDEETNSGVPFLMDIPLLGWLFKSNTVAKTKSELLIFITPRIIN